MPYRIHGKYLRNIPVLPDNISSAVEEFRVEAWQRLDGRIFLDDITDRMHPAFRVRNNALQQRNVRFRQNFGLRAWRSGNRRSGELSTGLRRKLEKNGIDPRMNSTRGLTPGLINPKLGETGGRVPLPRQWLNRREKQREEENRARARAQAEAEADADADSDAETEVGVSTQSQVPEVSEVPELSSSASDVSSEDYGVLSDASGELPQTPQSTEHEPQVIEFTHQFVPYEEYQSHPSGSLPVICGVIPDEQLPSTVGMEDLEKTQNTGQPSPVIEDRRDPFSFPLNPDQLNWNYLYSNPNEDVFHCHCEPSQQCEESTLQSIPTFDATPSEPETPSTGLFPVESPVKLDFFPEEQQQQLFGDLLNEYYKGERQLTDLPFFLPTDY